MCSVRGAVKISLCVRVPSALVVGGVAGGFEKGALRCSALNEGRGGHSVVNAGVFSEGGFPPVKFCSSSGSSSAH
jgi:hypothetical protein